MTPSTVTRARIEGQLKALMSGLGKARPEVSIRMCSGGLGRVSSASITGRNSSATVQHRQPLASSTMSSSAQPGMPHWRNVSPSMPISPNSLTMMAMRRPAAWDITWRSSVVFPAPRKPVTMVAGMRGAITRSPAG